MEYVGTDNLDIMHLAKNYNRLLVRQVLRLTKPEDRILDFGAGTGTFADLLRQDGRNVDCFEIDATHQARLRELGFTVISRVEDLGTYDCIYSFNVLEHIPDDAEALRTMHRCLQPNGVLALFVPAFQLLFSSMDRKVGHLRRYRRSSLARLVKEAGFEIISSSYADSLGFFASLLYKAVGSRRGDLSPSSILLYDRAIFPVSRRLDLGLGRLLGKNVMLAAKKI